jgi:copper chaperone CopZ
MADTAVSRFAIAGMTCGSCAVTARIAIQRSPGVYKAEVLYDEAKATVWYDSTRTSPDQIIAVLKKATGYVARELK